MSQKYPVAAFHSLGSFQILSGVLCGISCLLTTWVFYKPEVPGPKYPITFFCIQYTLLGNPPPLFFGSRGSLSSHHSGISPLLSMTLQTSSVSSTSPASCQTMLLCDSHLIRLVSVQKTSLGLAEQHHPSFSLSPLITGFRYCILSSFVLS